MNKKTVVIIVILGIILAVSLIEFFLGYIGVALNGLGAVEIRFDFFSYILGIIATVIGSTTVAFIAHWIEKRDVQKRSIVSLFSEIKHNQTLLQSLMGEKDNYISKHWAYELMPFQKANYDYAKLNGFLYTLKSETFEKISQAYDIIHLIEKERYGPNGTANTSFKKLGELLNDIINEQEA